MMKMQYARDEACTSRLAFFLLFDGPLKCFLCSLPASTSSSPPHLLLLCCLLIVPGRRYGSEKSLWMQDGRDTSGGHSLAMQSPSSLRFGLCWNIFCRTLTSPTWWLGSWTDDGSFSVASAYSIQFEGANCCSFQSLAGKSDSRFSHGLLSLSVASVIADNPLKHAGLAISCAPFAELCPRFQCTSDSAYSVQEPHCRAWRSLLRLVWWSTWKERNERVFRSKASLF
jgi:hypothetical protein